MIVVFILEILESNSVLSSYFCIFFFSFLQFTYSTLFESFYQISSIVPSFPKQLCYISVPAVRVICSSILYNPFSNLKEIITVMFFLKVLMSWWLGYRYLWFSLLLSLTTSLPSFTKSIVCLLTRLLIQSVPYVFTPSFLSSMTLTFPSSLLYFLPPSLPPSLLFPSSLTLSRPQVRPQIRAAS